MTKADDRPSATQAMLASAAASTYDPEVDIDWQAPFDDDLMYLPERLVSLYGTALWRRLSDGQRRELGRHEAVSLFSWAAYLDAFLTFARLRSVAVGRLTDEAALVSLAEVSIETRNATMFARLIGKTGIAPYRLPRGSLTGLKVLSFLPLGPSAHGASLIVDEVLDAYLREAVADPTVQPHVRQALLLHGLDSAREIAYARAEVERGLASGGAISRQFHSVVLAVLANVLWRLLIDKDVYRSIGISPTWGRLRARRNRRNNLRKATEPTVAFLASAGMCGGISRPLWRLTGTGVVA